MSTPVKLPELGESVTEGTITRWLKQVGDTVEVDEPLLEVSTDKVDTEVPSPVAGKILEIKAEEDETVEVGAELCVVGEEDEETSDSGDSGESEDESSEEEEESASDDDSDDSAEEEESASEDEDEEESSEDEEESSEDQEEDDEPEEKPAAKKSSGGGGGGGTPVTLPELGESVTEGTITRWLKKVGDEVEVDEPLLEVSTDKVDTEVPSPVAGALQEIKAEEDETVEVGAELCIIGEGAPEESGADESGDDESGGEESAEAEEPSEEEESTQEQQPSETPEDEGAGDEGAEEPEEEPEPAAEETEVEEERAEQQAPSKEKEEPAQPERQESAAASGDGGTYVTPLVRKMAAEHGVDLSSIKGTGVGGRIRKQDVLAAAEEQKGGGQAAAASEPAEEPAAAAAEPSPLRGQTEPMTRLRKVIAKRMVESLQTSAQLTTVVEVDVTGIARLRDSVKAEFQAREGVKLSFMPFFAKATTDALKAHPALNAKIDTDKGEITYFDHENLAIAVDTEKGLLTPVLKEAGDLSVSGLAKKIADLADRTRKNKIGPDDLSGGTFTLTNTGSRGALFDTPIINQPQVAILGTGAVVKRPVVIDDPNLGETIAVRHMCYLALTYDHRLVDGADAARFLSEVKERLESAQFEV